MRELEQRIFLMGQTVREQLTDSLAVVRGHDTHGAESVIERDDVVDNQRSALEDACFTMLRQAQGALQERRLRSALRVVYNLERIGDAASHIAKHCLMMAQEGDDALPLSVDAMAEIALTAVDEGVKAFVQEDLILAERACEREAELDALYIQRIQAVAALIDDRAIGGNVTLHLLATLKYLEKVCDFIRNIGETTAYSLTGARLSYPQFRELQALLADEKTPTGRYRHFWDGISGATVLEVESPSGPRLVFKEGASQKIEEEFRRSLEWEGIAPAHTAHVIGITRGKRRNGILREFADGSLLIDYLFSEVSVEAKESMVGLVGEVLTEIWTNTIALGPPRVDYTTQMRSRMRDLLRRHPFLMDVAKEELSSLGGLYDLLSHLASRENTLAPPFSVWIHGDLNADNIVVDPTTKSVIFIDVHRSRYGDYLQDVAVLSASTVRRFPRGKAAKAVRRTSQVLYDAAEGFAVANGDNHFKTRLRLARARAFITSARLETDTERAEYLFVEGLDSLKKVAKALKVGRRS